MTRRRIPDETGAALITVLLAVALASVLVAELLGRQYLDVRGAALLIEQMQAAHYARAGETLARLALDRDARRDGLEPADHGAEDWARPQKGFAIENGEIAFVIRDAQGAINLNALAGSDALQEATLRLLRNARLDAGSVAAIAKRLGIRERAGVEAVPPMPGAPPPEPDAAQGPTFYDIGEFSPPPGVNSNAFTVLPREARTINVNATPPALLKALLPENARLADLASQRRRAGSYVKKRELDELAPQRTELDVKSDYYDVFIEARYGDTRVWMVSSLHRERLGEKTARVSVRARDFGRRFLPETRAANP